MIPLLVVDVLETDGGFLDLDLIVDEVRRLRPGTRPDSIRRAVYRLLERGALERAHRPYRFNERQPIPIFRTTEDPWQHLPKRKARL